MDEIGNFSKSAPRNDLHWAKIARKWQAGQSLERLKTLTIKLIATSEIRIFSVLGSKCSAESVKVIDRDARLQNRAIRHRVACLQDEAMGAAVGRRRCGGTHLTHSEHFGISPMPPQGMIGTLEVEFCGEPSISLSV